MSDHDIQLLAIGITIGMYFMLLLQLVYGILDDRRDRKAARAAQAQLAATQRRISEPDTVDTYTDPKIIGKAGRL